MPTPALTYLMKNLNDHGDFSREWAKLGDQDKATLKDWAAAEMKVLGVE